MREGFEPWKNLSRSRMNINTKFGGHSFTWDEEIKQNVGRPELYDYTLANSLASKLASYTCKPGRVTY